MRLLFYMADRYDTYKRNALDHRLQIKIQRLKRIKFLDTQLGAQRLFCYEWSGLAGVVLATYMEEVYIIETYNHAVIFDSQNSWDFYINALFKNYRYPQTPCPPPIPIWEELPIETKGIKKFYSKEVLESAQAKNIGYKRIFKL